MRCAAPRASMPARGRRYPHAAMIRVSASTPWDAGLYPESVRAWSAERPARLAFATLWSTGSDPERDRLLRVQALRQAADGGFESYATFCRLEHAATGTAEAEHLGARLVREFGLHASDLGGAPDGAHALRELHAFLDGWTVITSARRPFLAWWRALAGAPAMPLLDLSEIAALCLPGRLAAEGEALTATLCGREPD